MRTALVLLMVVGFGLPAQAGKVDPEFAKFWEAFRAAVRKNDKEAVADMTRLPIWLDGKARDRAGFLQVYPEFFDPVRKQMENPDISKDKSSGSWFVFCGEQILIFGKKDGRYQFTETGVND